MTSILEVRDTSTMEAIEALQTANAEFAARLQQVKPEHMEMPTPCSEWNVRALINHVLRGTRMTIQVLDGVPREEVIAQLDDDLMSDRDPVAHFAELADQMVAAFAAPGGLEGIVAHPAGDFPRSMFIGFRVADGAAHAWDLATAIGADTTLDAGMVQFAWDDAQPQREMLTATGMFGGGPSGAVSTQAPLQEQYLDLLGRKP